MNGSGNSRHCEVCGSRLKRNGKTTAGTQRWRCVDCGASSVRRRADLARRAELDRFVAWLMGKDSQAEIGPGGGRTFRRTTAWCWNIEPALAVTGEIHGQVQMDGIYLGRGWCCLIAIADGHVIGWQWCDTEKSAAWLALMEAIPAPRAVVIDGGSGLASALSRAWPETRIQRGLVHVQRNVRTYLTLRPRTDAGRALRRISLALTRLKTTQEAAAWVLVLNQWHTEHGELIRARTYQQGPTGFRPAGVRAGQAWWYTHDRLRKAYRLMERLAKNGHLFTYLHPELADIGVDSTTNRIEGGVNTHLRALLRTHRGMPPAHAKRAVEWWLYTHSENPAPVHTLIRPEHLKPAPKAVHREERVGPETLGTGYSAEEGLWARKGWAGRPC